MVLAFYELINIYSVVLFLFLKQIPPRKHLLVGLGIWRNREIMLKHSFEQL